MKATIIILLTSMLSISAFAGYTYVVTDGMDLGLITGTLSGNQSLLMTGGGGGSLDLKDQSCAFIIGTSPYNQNVYPRGGIQWITLSGYTCIEISGGEIYEINMGNYAKAVLSGGTIQRLKTTQVVGGQIDPYVTLYHKGYEYNEITKMLTGFWGDGSAFAIQLVDVPNYTPTIDNINFIPIPEPATLLLFAVGGGLLRRRSRR